MKALLEAAVYPQSLRVSSARVVLGRAAHEMPLLQLTNDPALSNLFTNLRFPGGLSRIISSLQHGEIRQIWARQCRKSSCQVIILARPLQMS